MCLLHKNVSTAVSLPVKKLKLGTLRTKALLLAPARSSDLVLKLVTIHIIQNVLPGKASLRVSLQHT